MAIEKITKIEYKVTSFSNPNKNYDVIKKEGDWTCTCKAYEFSKNTPKICKHVIGVKMKIRSEK